MIANRTLNFDDYLAIVRSRLKLVLFLALVAGLIGLSVSFAFSPKYTSSSLVLVERQTIPSGYVKPIVIAALGDRVTILLQRVLSRNQLQGVVTRLGLAKGGKNVDKVIDEIQSNVQVSLSDPSAQAPGSSGSSVSPNSARGGDVPGLYVSFTSDNPRDAQQVCDEVTSMLLAENHNNREQVALTTTDFLTRQLEEAKSNLDERDKKFALFKNRYLGQLPNDADNNLKILMGLNSQLEANTQTLNRAQQDKSYTESILAQQLSAWKSSQQSLTSDSMEHRLAALETQLVAMEARYTDDYPEVIKIKRDIAALKAKQADMKASTGAPQKDGWEPPEILQFRQQIHQHESIIARATADHKRLQDQIDMYQGRLTLSPSVEEQYKQLTRDYDAAQKIYDSLLFNKSSSEMQTDLEHRQQGEQMRLLDTASLPTSPSFPVRWKFAAVGLGTGFVLGLGIVVWLELQDKTIRNEGDVIAALELPMLSSIPWLGPTAIHEPTGILGRFKRA